MPVGGSFRTLLAAASEQNIKKIAANFSKKVASGFELGTFQFFKKSATHAKRHPRDILFSVESIKGLGLISFQKYSQNSVSMSFLSKLSQWAIPVFTVKAEGYVRILAPALTKH